MNRTEHFSKRMAQRGISRQLAELATEIGDIHGDRYVLGRKRVDDELEKLDERRRLLLKARDKGGVVVVAKDGHLITTYRFDGLTAH